MTKSQFKKLYSTYRKAVSSFRADLESSNYPCGYDDSLCESFQRHTDNFLKNNPVIKLVLDNLDCSHDDYNPINDEFRNFRYQNSWVRNGKREWIKREV